MPFRRSRANGGRAGSIYVRSVYLTLCDWHSGISQIFGTVNGKATVDVHGCFIQIKKCV